MVREILVGIDFSEVSDRALDTAGEHARAWGARLHLLHVVPPTTDPAPSAGLERLAGEARDGGRVVVTAVAAGRPAAQIVHYAERHGVDLIVLGTHGRTGVSRALLGSVAEAVVRMASCPVLTVPPRRPTAAPAVPSAQAPPRSCVACGRPSDEDLVCAACRAHIRGEALERKQREERPGRTG
jgi:nucleotide-binding universal stress UspA family protein